MKLFSQVKLKSLQVENKDIVTYGVVISDDDSIVLLPCVDVDTNCDLFKITMMKIENPKQLLNIENEHNLHIYYVLDNSNHVYYNFVCKFIGSYLSYEELPEKCLMSVLPGIKEEIQKKDIVEMNEKNFRKAIDVTYKRCFFLGEQKGFITVEPRNISNVGPCDIVFPYNGMSMGLDFILFNIVPFFDINECDEISKYIGNLDFENFFTCKNISEQIKRFYSDYISRFRVPEKLIDYIKNDEIKENKFGFRFLRNKSGRGNETWTIYL